MRTFTVHEMKESRTEGFRAGIIEGRIRQERESNAAMRVHWLQGYARALHDAVEAVVSCDDYHSSANMLLVDAYREGLQAAREAIEAIDNTQQPKPTT